jgi:cytochrome d ubiquinol oxidase subunit II
MMFTLWGVIIVLPFVVGYTLYSYWVFRGKVEAEAGYH